MGCDQAKAANRFPANEAEKAKMTEPYASAKCPHKYPFILCQNDAISWKAILLLPVWIDKDSTILRWFTSRHQIYTSPIYC